jgi:beta-galactosidase beta subunit
MKKFRFTFTGRQAGAIGIFYKITDTYKAKDIHEALSYLYEDYEHIQNLKCNNGEIDIPNKINFIEVKSHKTRERQNDNATYKYTRSDSQV